jgi:hypothetical protein
VNAKPAPRRRGPIEVRCRQFRNAPRPVVRAVLSSLIVALVLGVGYLAYDLALSRGATLPGGDLRVLFLAAYAVVVLVAGSVITWLVVPQPSAALGLFAAVPIAWLVMVVLVQVVRPALVGA